VFKLLFNNILCHSKKEKKRKRSSIVLYLEPKAPGLQELQEHRRQQKPKERQRSRKRGTTPKEAASKQGKTSNLRAIFEQNRNSSTSTKRKKDHPQLHPIIIRALGREKNHNHKTSCKCSRC